MKMEKKQEYRLNRDDLDRMATIIREYIQDQPHETRDEEYPTILRVFAKSMLHDDALCGNDDYFDRRHGV